MYNSLCCSVFMASISPNVILAGPFYSGTNNVCWWFILIQQVIYCCVVCSEKLHVTDTFGVW
jgi:hypothetical protein